MDDIDDAEVEEVNAWIRAEILPVADDDVKICLKLLERFVSNDMPGNPVRFASSTAGWCWSAASQISLSLVNNLDAPPLVRIQACATVIATDLLRGRRSAADLPLDELLGFPPVILSEPEGVHFLFVTVLHPEV